MRREVLVMKGKSFPTARAVLDRDQSPKTYEIEPSSTIPARHEPRPPTPRDFLRIWCCEPTSCERAGPTVVGTVARLGSA